MSKLISQVLDIRYNRGGFMFTLLSLIGFGITTEMGNDEKSLTFTFKLWKLHSINSIAIL